MGAGATSTSLRPACAPVVPTQKLGGTRLAGGPRAARRRRAPPRATRYPRAVIANLLAPRVYRDGVEGRRDHDRDGSEGMVRAAVRWVQVCGG